VKDLQQAGIRTFAAHISKGNELKNIKLLKRL
jgi:hypothetical protein